MTYNESMSRFIGIHRQILLDLESHLEKSIDRYKHLNLLVNEYRTMLAEVKYALYH